MLGKAVKELSEGTRMANDAGIDDEGGGEHDGSENDDHC